MAEQQQKLFLKQLTINIQTMKRFIQKEMNEQREKCYEIYKTKNENYEDYYQCIISLQQKRKQVDFNYESMQQYWPFWAEQCFQNAKDENEFQWCQQHVTDSVTNFLQTCIDNLQV